MKKLLIPALLASFVLSGCQRHFTQPYEVVDESYLHRYGVAIPKQDWSAQGETGKVVSTLKNGVVVTKSYVKGVLEGDTTYTYPHSDLIESTETYSNGKVVKVINFYRNGAKSQETTFPNDTQRKVISYFDNGAVSADELYDGDLLTTGNYYSFTGTTETKVENGKGQRTNRDAFGNLASVDHVEKGAITSSKTFYPNGSVEKYTPYVGGKVSGEVRTFLPGGEPSTVEVWNQGERTGITVIFENGEKVASIPYLRGVKDGIERRYKNGETVVEEISWVQDVKHGPSVTRINGITKTDYYLQGTQVTQSTFEKMTNGITTYTPR